MIRTHEGVEREGKLDAKLFAEIQGENNGKE